MMDDKHLLRIALLFSFLGLAALFLISRNIEINDTTIEKINRGEIVGKAVLEGTVKSIRQSEKATFIVLSQESDLNVIAFSNIAGLETGDRVKITGDIDDGEILAEKIEKVVE
ncbi:hypothetical protein JXC34_02980 [Candidatus Woesearchaeota archaeon]|nr:hypothetical protein [Candidatus Woesearchaeota archaeon]